MDIQGYLDQKKKLYSFLLDFISNSNEDYVDFDSFTVFLNSQNLLNDHEEMVHLLKLISDISNNHHREPDFFSKIYKILQFLFPSIQQNLTNREIFDIFKSNKLILLFLHENQILTFDDYALKYMTFTQEGRNMKLFKFFFLEMKRMKETNEIKIEIDEKEFNEFNTDLKDILEDFEDNRKIGENESYICKLIRTDSIEEFISYVNKTNLSLSNTTIKQSIFETNPFLFGKTPSLIEYAAFFGSIQIIQYLKMNRVELTESLWLFAIHSNNAELIHFLEGNQIKPIDETYEQCLLESIKCHHNDVAKYIEDILLIQKFNNSEDEDKLNENIISTSFLYSNYEYLPTEFDKHFAFFYLNKHHFSTLVNLFLQMKKKNLDTTMIYTISKKVKIL